MLLVLMNSAKVEKVVLSKRSGYFLIRILRGGIGIAGISPKGTKIVCGTPAQIQQYKNGEVSNIDVSCCVD